jgi:hypothetical protein
MSDMIWFNEQGLPLGFNVATYFNRRFRAHFAASPTQSRGHGRDKGE